MSNNNSIKFIPVKGLESKIRKEPVKDGYVYFATDSGKIYVDSQGKRSAMGAAGAAIYYGTADTVTEDKEIERFLLPKEAVEDKSVKIGDLILNSDGGFYKVEELGQDNYLCSLISVSGTGGGLAKTRPTINLSIDNTNLINGQKASFHIKAESALDADGNPIDEDLNVIYSLGTRISDTVINKYITQTKQYKTADSGYKPGKGKIDDYIEIGDLLRPDTTSVLSVYVQGGNHDDISATRKIDISTSPMKLSQVSGFNPATKYKANTKFDIRCNVIGSLSKVLYFYYDDMNNPAEVRVLTANQANTIQSFNVSTDKASHGYHTIKIELFQNIGTDTVPKKGLGVPALQYEIAVVDDSNPNAKPVIWLGDYQKKYYNYDAIQIPFLVYDPASASTAKIHLYKNKVELESSPRDITDFSKFTLWEIADATMDGINSYQISCGETDDRYVEREINFTVEEDPERNMIVEQSDLLLNFSAIGRSNTEAAAKRQNWSYELNGVKKTALFENFNWYNNGWIIDDEKNTPDCSDITNTSCLRISNGAKFRIPFQQMIFGSNTGGQISHTVEMQLRIRNIQKYDNLISNITRYQNDSDWYENFKAQKDTGYDNYDAYLQWYLPTIDKMYDDLKFSHVEKNININNVVAGLYDYNSVGNKVTGFCVGTQDAFFSNGENTVNVDFVENELINLSFVYQHSLKQLYIYINGVITGVIKSSKSSSFSINSSEFIFDSKNCDIDLFKVRVYSQDLNVNQIVTNFAVDRKNVKIFDQSGKYSLAIENQNLNEFQFSYEQMLKYNEAHPNAPLMPYIIYDIGTGKLPYSKDDTKYISVEFVNTPLEAAYVNGTLEELARKDGLIAEGEIDAKNIEEGIKTYYKHHCPSWTSNIRANDRVEFAVQGTSSEFYPRRNYKIKTKMDFNNCWDEEKGEYTEEDNLNIFMNRGPYAEIYAEDKETLAANAKYLGYEKSRLSDGWYMNNYTNPTDRWTMKVDFMESSGSYNAGFASMVGNAYTKHPLQDYLEVMNETDKLKSDIDKPMFEEIQWNDYRTSLLGFPVLAFQKSGSGEDVKYTFIGLYRMLLDKGSSQVLGFKPNKKITSKFFTNTDKNGKIVPKPMREIAECWEFSNNARGFCSFRDPWNRVELSFKAPPMAKNAYTAYGAPVVANSFEYRYHDKKDDIDILYKFDQATQAQLNEVAKNLDLPENSIVAGEANRETGANALLTTYKNWEKVCKWVWSTNLDVVASQGIYSYILVSDTPYEKDKYYIVDLSGNSESGFIKTSDDFDEEVQYYEQKISTDQNGNTEINYVQIRLCAPENLYDPSKKSYYYQVSGQGTADDNDDVYALATGAFDNQIDYYTFTSYEEAELNEKFDLLVRPVDLSYDTFDINTNYYLYDGSVTTSKGQATGAVSKVESANEADFNLGMYYVANPITYTNITYTHDSKEYRAAKFINEFEDYFDAEYVATYFVMTEVMELYDSRGKNCMMASWGPTRYLKDDDDKPILDANGQMIPTNGYIWYPIFYDIDTQLGINNTGIPSFKFNVDATEQANFSTSDSILWNNFYKFFKKIWMLPKYRNLRGNDTEKFAPLLNEKSEKIAPLQSVDYIEKWYNFDPKITNNIACEGERPLLAKNLDMYFKYITICNSKAKEEGVAHLGGEGSQGAFADPDTGTYYYALQGDRSQSRRQFIDSRLDYIDSWLTQGNYARGGANRLWGRISANNRSDLNSENIINRHSDKWTETANDPYWVDNIEFGTKTHEFDAEYWFEPQPIRSAYVTAGEDSMNYPSQKYDGTHKLYFILHELENGIRTSHNYPEQLLYLYGTNSMSSFGDLSKMYWTEFKLEGKANKLTELKLGHDGTTIDYRDGSAKDRGEDKEEINWYINELNGITLPNLPLLKEVNFCNIGLKEETSLDFTASEKLENFRATGSSNITSIRFADGVALNTLYLPQSVGTLSLTQANLLTDLIGQDADHPYEIPKLDPVTDKLIAKKGLYLERFFDGNSSLNNIKLIDGALGYNSYTILKRLYDLYKNETASSAYATMTNVQWCPYTRLTEGDIYDDSKDYYIDDGHYGFIKYNDNDYIYNESKFNIDILSGNLYRDDGHGGRKCSYNIITLNEITYKPNVYYIKNGDKYELATETFDNNLNYYEKEILGFEDIILNINDDAITMLENLHDNGQFKSADEIGNPLITGVIYINNENPIEESYINNVLQTYYPNLTFFFANVTKAYSAKFVLIDKDTGAEKFVDHRIAGNSGPTVQKIKATEINSKYFLNPYEQYKVERSHWDFYGWSTSSDENDKSSIIYGDIVDGMTEEDIIAAHNIAWNNAKANIIEEDKYDYTFYAILTEHQYIATFKDTFDSSYQEISTTAYSDKGSYMSDKVPPPANYRNNELYMRNAFKGWTLDENKAKQVYGSTLTLEELPIINVKDYPATRDYTFYAIYQEESVFNEIAPNDYFDFGRMTGVYNDKDATYSVDYSAQGGYYLALKPEYADYLKGKITLPTMYNNLPIYQYKNLNAAKYLTHVFFDKTYPCEVRRIQSDAFINAPKLEYIDFIAMPKLRSIGSNAFNNCPQFVAKEFYNPLLKIEEFAFAAAGKSQLSESFTLRFNPSLEEIANNSFQYGCIYDTIIFGKSISEPSNLKQNDWLNTTAGKTWCITHNSNQKVKTIKVFTTNESMWEEWLKSGKYNFINKAGDCSIIYNETPKEV